MGAVRSAVTSPRALSYCVHGSNPSLRPTADLGRSQSLSYGRVDPVPAVFKKRQPRWITRTNQVVFFAVTTTTARRGVSAAECPDPKPVDREALVACDSHRQVVSVYRSCRLVFIPQCKVFLVLPKKKNKKNTTSILEKNVNPRSSTTPGCRWRTIFSSTLYVV